MGEGEIGTETDRSFVARERLDIAALLMTHIAELIMRVGECGELCNREFELRGGFVEPTRSGERNAVVVAHLRVVWQQTHCGIVCGEPTGDQRRTTQRIGQFAA